MDKKEVIADCYRRMYDGMVAKDRKVLSEVLDESFVLIHMSGMRQSKEAFIGAVEDGTLNYYSARHQKIDVEFAGDKAQLIGKSMVNAAVLGGGRHTWRLQLGLDLILKDGTWLITEARASTY